MYISMVDLLIYTGVVFLLGVVSPLVVMVYLALRGGAE